MVPKAPREPKAPQPTVKATLALPKRDVNRMPQVFNYLRYLRGIPGKIINLVIDSGKLYADNRGNAVFYYLEKKKRQWGQNFEAPLVYVVNGGRAWLPVQENTWERFM